MAHTDTLCLIAHEDGDVGLATDPLPMLPWFFRCCVLRTGLAFIIWELYDEIWIEGSEGFNRNWAAAITTLLVALGFTSAEIVALKSNVREQINQLFS